MSYFKLNNIEQAIKIKKTFCAIDSMKEYKERDNSLINAVNNDLLTAFDEFKFTFVQRVTRIADYFKQIDCLAEELESQ